MQADLRARELAAQAETEKLRKELEAMKAYGI